MLTLKSVSMVMTMRKTAVRMSSSVRTHGGGGGRICRVEDVESLLLVTLFVVDVPGPVKAGGERDASWGLGRCMRGRMFAQLCRRGAWTQYVTVVESFWLVGDWMAGVDKTVATSTAVRRGRRFILGASEAGLGGPLGR